MSSKLIIENFKPGLDDRRDVLSTLPGALSTLNNAHINQGGEIEKRKAFTRMGGITMPSNTFGLQDTSDGLVTFGSAASPNAALPSGVTYQRLQHPDGGVESMTAVRFSASFGGLAFVIARYTDGRSLAFYNGTLVTDFVAGLILLYLNTLPEIADNFESLVNATAFYDAVQRAPGNDDKVDVYGVPGNSYGVSITLDLGFGSSGTLASSRVTEFGSPATLATEAIAKFAIIAGNANPGTNKVTNVKVNGVSIVSAPTDWVFNNETTALAVAGTINATQANYHATAVGNTIKLVSVATGAALNGYSLEITTGGTVCTDDCSFNLTGSNFNVGSVTADGVELTSAGWRTTPGTTDNFPAVSAILETYCSLLADGIRAGVGTHGYTAVSLGTRVYVSRQVVLAQIGAIMPTIIVTLTGTGNTTEGDVNPFTATLDNTAVSGTFIYNRSTPSLTGRVTASPIGGSSPYTYEWKEATPGSANGIYISDSRKYRTHFNYIWPGGTVAPPIMGTFVCVITDAFGLTTTTPTVTVTYK